MWHEEGWSGGAGQGQLLLDLRSVTMGGDPVRAEVLVHLGEELFDLGGPTRARSAGLGVDDRRRGEQPGPRERGEAEESSGRVAAGIGDEPCRA